MLWARFALPHGKPTGGLLAHQEPLPNRAGRLLAGISIIHFPPTQKVLLTTAQCNYESSLQSKVLSRATEGAIRASRENPTDLR